MKITKLLLAALLCIFLLNSCSEDEISQPPKYVPLGSYDSGTLVLNQGSFTNLSTISYLSFDLNLVQNNIFDAVNPGKIFGQFAEDLVFNGEKAFASIGGAAKIEIFNRYTLKSIGSITSNLENPRYILFANNKMYVSNFGTFDTDYIDDYISVYDANSYAFIKKIVVPGGSANKMLLNNGKIYLAQGTKYDDGRNIVIIDTNTDTEIKRIPVAENPSSLQIADGSLWVMCYGIIDFASAGVQTNGVLVKIKLSTDTYDVAYQLPQRYLNPADITSPKIFDHPENFIIQNGFGYYTVNSSLFKVNLTPSAPDTPITFPTSALIANVGQTPNALSIKNNSFFVADATDFTNNGFVRVYSLGSTEAGLAVGQLLKVQTVGIAPSGFYFNQ